MASRGLARWVADLGADVRYGWRGLLRSPAFLAVAILSLALGIGANTAIFSLIDAVMLRTLPVRDPQQLVELLSHYPGDPRMNVFGWKHYLAFRERNDVFSAFVATAPSRSPFQVSRDGSPAEAVYGEFVVGDFFTALGMTPAAGRLIAVEDDQPDRSAVAVISWPYWKSRFNLDPAVVGRTIAVNGAPLTVVGVAPRRFEGLQTGFRTDIWMPVAEAAAMLPGQPQAREPLVAVIGRLKEGVSLERARAQMRVLDRPRLEEMARGNPGWRQATLDVEPAGAGSSGLRDLFGRQLLVLMAIVALMLAISCTNIASLLLARATVREPEMAVRLSLGATRWRLVRLVLTEAVILSAVAIPPAVWLAYAGARGLARAAAAIRIVGARQFEIPVQIDARVLIFTAAIAALTALVFGLAPARQAFHVGPGASLRDRAVRSDPRSRRVLGKSLVMAQVALSLVALTGGSLFIQHLSNLRDVDTGFRRDSVLLVTLDPRGGGLNRTQLTALYRQLLERFNAIPGVQSATLSGMTPISGGAASRFVRVDGFTERPEDRRYVSLNMIAPRYFETLGTPLVAGRDFSFDDATGPRVAIVNQAFARYYFANGSPLGKHVTIDWDDRPYEIVGVSADAKYADLHQPAPRTVYIHTFQDGRVGSVFALRTSGSPGAVAADARRAVDDVVKTVRVAGVTTLADQVDASLVPERLVAALSGLFGAIGVALAAVGLYGLLAYTIVRRTREIGIRMALGATPRGVVRMVLGDAGMLIAGGLVIGTPLAIWGRRVAAGMVPGLRVEALPLVATAAAVMVAAGLLAAWLPARHAARVQPLEALRRE